MNDTRADSTSAEVTPLPSPVRSPEPAPTSPTAPTAPTEPTESNVPTETSNISNDCDTNVRNDNDEATSLIADVEIETEPTEGNVETVEIIETGVIIKGDGQETIDNEIASTSQVVDNVSEDNESNNENELVRQQSDDVLSQGTAETNASEEENNEVSVNGDEIPGDEDDEVELIEIVAESLTFDENHFSTPTGGSPEGRSPTSRRRRTTASSMDDSEVRTFWGVTCCIVYKVYSS